MILAFEFKYLSKNGVLETILKEICSDFTIKHLIVRESLNVTLYVEETEERLGVFADTLGNSLPLSIFFKSSSVYVADAFPSLNEELPLLNVPVVFTPKRLKAIECESSSEYLLPYSDFQIGKDILTFQDTRCIVNASDVSSLNTLYDALTQALCDGKTVELELSSGRFIVGKIDVVNKLSHCDNLEIIPTDLSVVERMVVIRENEIKALASLERPAIRCKINAMFAQKNIFPMQRVLIRLADEFLLHHLCKRLFAQGVQFLFRAPCSTTPADTHLRSTHEQKLIESLTVCVLENGEIVLVKGESFASKTVLENRKKFEAPSHGAFASIMQEHQLFDNKVGCFYLSTYYDDKIMHYSAEHGMLDLTHFAAPHSIDNLFKEITRSSASAVRLVENYKEQFPEIYQNALAVEIPENAPKSIFTLWKVVSIVLGFSKEFESAAQSLIELAEDFGGQKGPRMDYFLEKEEALVSDFDYVRLIRSGMSFKLAGTDDATLAFGYMQSLAYFLSDMSDYYKEHLGNEKMALAGSLFGYRRFSEMAYKNLKPNHPICFNVELPIDTQS